MKKAINSNLKWTCIIETVHVAYNSAHLVMVQYLPKCQINQLSRFKPTTIESLGFHTTTKQIQANKSAWEQNDRPSHYKQQ